MVYFITLENHTYTVDIFCQHMQLDFCKVITYEEKLPPINHNDVVLLCDIDRCDSSRIKIIQHLYDQLLPTGCKILNNPYKAMGRFELCNQLYQSSINTFRLFRPDDLEGIRFPVFVREEYDHNGALSYLIDNHEQLTFVLEKLSNRKNLVVAEFVDVTKSELGCFHKYGAFIINGIVLPRHFFVGEDWNVKQNSLDPLISSKLEADYLAENPHREEIKRIAELANINYGRIDYAITHDGIQVFEINTNPTIIDAGDLNEESLRFKHTLHFEQELIQVLMELNVS